MANRANAIASGVGSLKEVFDHYSEYPDKPLGMDVGLKSVYLTLVAAKDDLQLRCSLLALFCAFLNEEFSTSHRINRVRVDGICDQSYVIGQTERELISTILGE